MTPRTERNYLLYQLQSQLYTDFYIRGTASAGTWNDAGGLTDAVGFVERLSAANTCRGSRENGWEVLTTAPGQVVVRRGGLTLWVQPEDCIVPEGGSVEPGRKLPLHLPKELLNISPGYYLALSDEGNHADDAQGLLRLYWNLRAEGAESFVGEATRALNEARVFFKLKVLSDPRSYARCDAGVVYLRREDYLNVADIQARVYSRVAGHLKPGTPMFTKLLAPGLGLAEDPGRAESFGQHRCRLLAEGMIRAYQQGARELDQRLTVVTDCYASAGVKLTQPYLNPNSPDLYTFPGERIT